MTTPISMAGEHAIVFFVLDRDKSICGYSWLIEWSTTSFYIKSNYPALKSTKVSLHGPDPKHPGKEHFRFDFDRREAGVKAANAGGGMSVDATKVLPIPFTGRRVNKRTLHVLRFSTEWGMFLRGVPSAPVPTTKGKATVHATIEAPSQLRVVHVDVYLSNGSAYWHDEAEVRDRNAGLGPIINSANQYLTAEVGRVKATAEPDPFGNVQGDTPLDRCIRGIAVRPDPSGFLWICEKMIPQSVFTPLAAGPQTS
ncbi:hypothetical protein FZI91_14700 [Mycobacterium sp. CBMA271]|uniref:hypothetical protein n=1 Tax=unclassified Mycobacteroides TaxID=2618759 RepID=UPI0012DBE7FC|nr:MULTISPECIES: hypothetical protein [unclassified Mycobacteroides]MUM22948.1 hypothetical protein [Mycobacteroides sp. CBMA 271]